MLGCLFDEENDGIQKGSVTNIGKGSYDNSAPRCDVDDLTSPKLVGISNQGATCYLNSLIQTLFLTPELRDSVLAVPTQELGEYGDPDGRVIMLQLQMLFAEMLLLDKAVVSTTRLTDSFGWSNAEGLIQNDVQELNRILFAAIEHSLEGTSAANLVNDLYKGTTVNQIRCKECDYVSEREETYLDLTLAVCGYSNLGDSLTDSYLNTETLSGSNQYKCQRCDKLVDAEKGAKIRSLPPILTFCLLRLTYDYERGQRKKETSKYSFPMQLSMSAYTETPSDIEDDYELFSVLVHRGGAGGGHYHALIRDIDCLGNWTNPKPARETSDQLLGKAALERDALRSFDGPHDLLEYILGKYDGSMHIENLRQCIVQETGFTWNKGYKKYGSVTKFISSNPEMYTFDQPSQTVILVSHEEKADGAEKVDNAEKPIDSEKAAVTDKSATAPQGDLADGNHWFSLDDRRVVSVNETRIENYFGGKECAYMLFYRRKSLSRPPQARSNSMHCVPSHLLRAVKLENDILRQEREAKLKEINTVKLHVYLQSHYKYLDGFVCAKTGHIFKDVSIDQRLTISELLCQVISELDDDDVNGTDLYLVRPLHDGYLHLISHLSDSANHDEKISSCNISSDMGLLFTSKTNLEKHDVVCGLQNEPILIHVDYDGDYSNMRIDKSIPMSQFHSILLQHLNSQQSLHAYHKCKQTLTLLPPDEQQAVSIFLCDQSSVIVSQNPISVDNYRSSMRLRITYNTQENLTGNSPSMKSVVIIIEKNKMVSDAAQLVCAEYQRQHSVELSAHSLRLKPIVNDEPTAPLYNDMVLEKCKLSNDQSLQIEVGQTVSTREIVLYFFYSLETDVYSIKCNVTNSIQQVTELMVKAITSREAASFNYYLQTTDYFGSPSEILYDRERTLAQLRIRHGDTLCLTEGTPPPKDLVTFSVYMSVSNDSNDLSYEDYLSRVMQSLHISDRITATTQTRQYQSYQMALSASSTVEELKQSILSKAGLPEHDASCTRLRNFHDGLPSKILKMASRTLKEYKVKDQVSLLLEILEFPEAFNDGDVVLQLVEIDEEGRMTPPAELIWDTRQGNTAKQLRFAVRSRIKADSTYEFLLAMYRPSTFDWKMIRQPPSHGKGSAKKKKRNSDQNLCKAPYTLQDGDMIGCFSATEKTRWMDDLTYQTDQDKEFKAKYLAIKRQQREARKETEDDLLMAATAAADTSDSSTKSKSTKEQAITIRVGDFSKKTSHTTAS